MPLRPTIAVDMDEVIADALGEHLTRYNREFSGILHAPLTTKDLQGRWLWDAVPPAHLPALERYMMSEDFFRVLPVFPHAQRVLARLQTRYDIYIATAAMEVPSSFTPKFHWLAEHFPFIPHSHIVFCGNKSILRADFLIDDNPRQLRLFEGQGQGPNQSPSQGSSEETGQGTAHETARQGILFSSPANVHVTGFRRVRDWLDVESLFMDQK